MFSMSGRVDQIVSLCYYVQESSSNNASKFRGSSVAENPYYEAGCPRWKKQGSPKITQPAAVAGSICMLVRTFLNTEQGCAAWVFRRGGQ